MSAFARVAYIAKTRNLEGSVVATSADGLPFLLYEGMEVHFVPPSLRGPRCARVSFVSQLKDDSYEVAFEGVESIDDAEKLAGCYCLAAKDTLPEVDAMDDPRVLLDFSVQDKELGDLGAVVEVMLAPAQAILVTSGPYGEVMIPVVDEFVSDIDFGGQTVFVEIPKGLVSINSKEDKEEQVQ